MQSLCEPGWCSLNPDTNTNCQIPADTSCPSSYCSDHGLCFHDRDGVIFCNCSEAYSGTRCELRYEHSPDTCNPDTYMFHPCINGGRCVMHSTNNYSCQCAIGFRGDFCEIKTRVLVENTSRPECENGGTTYKHGHIFICLCACGFDGFLCETIFRSCCGLPICHGNGICKTDNRSYSYCDCAQGFSGQCCENKSGDVIINVITTTARGGDVVTSQADDLITPSCAIDTSHLAGVIISVVVLFLVLVEFAIVLSRRHKFKQDTSSDELPNNDGTIAVNLNRTDHVTLEMHVSSSVAGDDVTTSPVSLEVPSYEEACLNCEKPPEYLEAVEKYIISRDEKSPVSIV